jgi:hypothetical protein
VLLDLDRRRVAVKVDNSELPVQRERALDLFEGRTRVGASGLGVALASGGAGGLRRIRPSAVSDYFERNRGIVFLARTFFNILPIARVDIRAQDHSIRAQILPTSRPE